MQYFSFDFHSSFLFLSPLLLALTILVVVVTLYELVRRRMHVLRPNDKRLPPGSMGWPYLGETFKLYTENPNSFFSNRLKRYGDIFKTHILGCPCVMISSPKAAKLVLVSKAHLFKPTYPPSKEKMIGPQALFFHQGNYHSNLKKLVQASFLPSVLRGAVSQIENIVLDFLPSWENNNINTLHEMKKYAFDVAMITVFGDKGESEKEGIKHLYHCLEKGYNSMPLNFPGTPFHKAMKEMTIYIGNEIALYGSIGTNIITHTYSKIYYGVLAKLFQFWQARKLLNEILKRLIAKRRKENNLEGGLLGVLLKSKDQKTSNNNNSHQLSDEQISDNVIGVIFAAHDTTASVLTWLLKYLHDNQDLLQSVTKEQQNIRQKVMSEGNRGLTWEDTRNMPLTTRVIQETLRTASILSFTFREAVQDVEFEGYLIPKGWKVLPLFRSIHHCADFFPQPDKFDPSRFEVPPRPNTYMPFGNGVHSCPGSELAKLEMLIFLHHLTTTCRWKVVGDEDGIQYVPFPVPKHGFPISVHPRK